MKSIKKLFPLALGLLTLASCSSDDFFGDDSSKQDIRANLGKGDMVVSVADPIWIGNSITRGLADFDVSKKIYRYYFTTNDQLRVYDKYLTGYDLYTYSPSTYETTNDYKFRMVNAESNIGDPVFALYPREDIVRGFWEYKRPNGDTSGDYTHGDDNHTRGWVKVNIAPYMKYEADYTSIFDKDKTMPLYKDRLPMFGKVESTEKGYVEATMEYLTGILCWSATTSTVEGVKVVVIDRATGQPLQIAGRFTTDLMEDNKVKLAYIGEGDAAKVDESNTARLKQKNFLKENEYFAYDDDENYPTDNKIIVDVVNGNNELIGDHASHLKVIVPLVCTDDLVDIVVYQTAELKQNADGEDISEWVETWRKKNTKIERGQLYSNEGEYNSAIDGVDICAINDALVAKTAEAKAAGLEEGGVIELIAKNPIEVNTKCSTLFIPNENYQFVINMKKGLYSKTSGATLNVEYLNPTGEVTAQAVQILAKRNIEGGRSLSNNSVALDAQLPKSIFSLVNVLPAAGEDQGWSNKTPFAKTIKVDATDFVFGNGEDLSLLAGNSMLLSDKVKSLIVKEKAVINYVRAIDGDVPYGDQDGLVIPDTDAPAGYQNAAIDSIAIEGTFLGGIDAHAPEAKAVNLTVTGTEEYGVLAAGDYRVKGKIDVLGKGFIWAYIGNPRQTPYTGVAAAYEGVTVKGQSFISGAVFTKNKNITIENVDFNMNDILRNGGKLSDLIYELFSEDMGAQYVTFLKNFGYGPLYAETGSISISADNSDLMINNRVNNEYFVVSQVNPHVAQTVQFTVYAKGDIDLETSTENGGTIDAYGNMWSQEDVNLVGEIRSRGAIFADHNYAMQGKSRANFVSAGYNATVSVDPQDGLCEAIETLNFFENKNNAEGNNGNTLFLTEGYIGTVINAPIVFAGFTEDEPQFEAGEPFEVKLQHGAKPAYAAIREVIAPDFLVATNESKWNGKLMPTAMRNKYVATGSDPAKPDLWTASELAEQTVQVTTLNAKLRSDIDLGATNEWPGITTNQGEWANYTFDGLGHTVKNVTIISKDKKTAGFIDHAYGTLGVSNLTLDNVTTKIARNSTDEVSYGTGAVVGRAEKAAKLERVKVTLGTGNFGSDGTNNKKSSNIGGALGAALGNAILSGVQVDATKATITGYHSLGGFIGKAKANVTIEKNGPVGDLDEILPSVTGLKIQVTYVKNADDETANDLNQMKHGLYIGSADFVAGTDGTPAVYYKDHKEYKDNGGTLEKAQYDALPADDPQRIKTPAVPGTDASTIIIKNAQEASTAYTVTETLDGCTLINKVFYHLQREGETLTSTYKFAKGDQTMIGFCGKEVVNPRAIMINGLPYWIKIQGRNGTADIENILYKFTKKSTE